MSKGVQKIPGWSRVSCMLMSNFGKESWYHAVQSYCLQRYHSLETRMIDSFRFVECHPRNRNTFSYEYSSILRDAGSVFSSIMDRLVRETVSSSGELDITAYREWLRNLEIPCVGKKIEKIWFISVDLNYPLESRTILPFFEFKEEDGRLQWWNAYNKVKHSDIENYDFGNLENALNSVGAIAILSALLAKEGNRRLFIRPGVYHPENHLLSSLFFKI